MSLALKSNLLLNKNLFLDCILTYDEKWLLKSIKMAAIAIAIDIKATFWTYHGFEALPS